MNLLRLFDRDPYKGEQNYLATQRKYELGKTILFFAISFALFLLGLLSTKTKSNLLTIVAVLGMLPASKALVETIMFFRYKGMAKDLAEEINTQMPKDAFHAFDRVFTSYSQNYVVDHLLVSSGSICGYSSQENFKEKEFDEHISSLLLAEGHKNVTVKIFTDYKKYKARLDQLLSYSQEEEESKKNAAIMQTLLNVSL